ncbi:glycerophosphodiester phosphodiesterase domain-containing protein 5-like isoform X2 [Apostichopus japonicus]|uniref:glycerophosphodiester phosphodiesterase domain-containing protein 5-like isoform X2 n=1 Tax=Stichopus japonicus TaxID=307972 RepID=UPI003AB7ADEF
MVSQSHIRLEREQNYHNQVCLSCIAGLYGCRWKRYRRSKEPSSIAEKVFAGITTLSFLCATAWLYFWIIAENDAYDFNRFIAVKTHSYFNWFTLFYALTVLCVIYTGLLVVFAVSHMLIGLQLHLHWFHKVLVVTVILGSIVSSVLLSKYWPMGFALVWISFKVTGPILHILSVVLVTFLGWIVSIGFFRINLTAVKYSLVVCFSILAVSIYLIPLFTFPPCLMSGSVPTRPKVMAHRGALQLAPENTQVSFETALKYDISGFETDVSISLDGELFLLHDETFEMTTNITEVFPERAREPASNFMWDDIKQLGAGSWFLERDPFKNVRHLSESEKALYRSQSIMLLKDLLDIAIRENKSVVFDLRRPVSNSSYFHSYVNHTISEILKHNIKEHQIWWLVGDSTSAQEIQAASSLFLVTGQGRWNVDSLKRFHITNVNAEYSEVFKSDIERYSSQKITSNIYQVSKRWLFSLLWCENVTSVTSSACQTLDNVSSPKAFMSAGGYLALWIITDLLSVILIIGFFLLHRHRYSQQGRRKSDKELLFGTKKKTTSSPQASDSDSPVRTPQEILNAADATQKDSLPSNEVVNFQLE